MEVEQMGPWKTRCFPLRTGGAFSTSEHRSSPTTRPGGSSLRWSRPRILEGLLQHRDGTLQLPRLHLQPLPRRRRAGVARAKTEPEERGPAGEMPEVFERKMVVW